MNLHESNKITDWHKRNS